MPNGYPISVSPQRRASLGREAIDRSVHPTHNRLASTKGFSRKRSNRPPVCWMRTHAWPQRRASLGREAINTPFRVAHDRDSLNEGLLSEEKQLGAKQGPRLATQAASTKGFSRKRSNSWWRTSARTWRPGLNEGLLSEEKQSIPTMRAR